MRVRVRGRVRDRARFRGRVRACCSCRPSRGSEASPLRHLASLASTISPWSSTLTLVRGRGGVKGRARGRGTNRGSGRGRG